MPPHRWSLTIWSLFPPVTRPAAALLRVKDNRVEKIWGADDVLSNHYATSVHSDGYLFGFDGRQEYGENLRCVEFKSGKIRWSEDRFWRGHGHFGWKAPADSHRKWRTSPRARITRTFQAGDQSANCCPKAYAHTRRWRRVVSMPAARSLWSALTCARRNKALKNGRENGLFGATQCLKANHPRPVSPAASPRLMSLDALRGFDMFGSSAGRNCSTRSTK